MYFMCEALGHMGRRKAVMVEEELVDQVKAIAQRYGMSISSYMRRLLRAALTAETQGIHAPQAIARGIMLSTLARLSLIPLPLQLLQVHSIDDLRETAWKVGKMLRNLDVDTFDLISLITEFSGLGFSTPAGIKIITVPGDPALSKLEAYLAALAEAAGLDVERTEENIVIIRHKGFLAEKRGKNP